MKRDHLLATVQPNLILASNYNPILKLSALLIIPIYDDIICAI